MPLDSYSNLDANLPQACEDRPQVSGLIRVLGDYVEFVLGIAGMLVPRVNRVLVQLHVYFYIRSTEGK